MRDVQDAAVFADEFLKTVDSGMGTIKNILVAYTVWIRRVVVVVVVSCCSANTNAY